MIHDCIWTSGPEGNKLCLICGHTKPTLTKGKGWWYIGVLVACFAGTPLISFYVGEGAAGIFFLLTLLYFCYGR